MRNTPHSSLVFTLYPQIYSRVSQLAPGANQGGTRVFAGFITTSVVTLVTHPVDTLRVRLSTQAPGQIRYIGIGDAIRTIYNTEGCLTFYRGLWPTILGAGPRGGIGFGVFESLKAFSERKGMESRFNIMPKLVFGALAGMASDFATYPLDTVRRRQQTFGRTRALGEFEKEFGSSRVQQTKGVFSTLRDVFRVEGVRGLYKGAGLSMFKTPIASGVSFCVNDLVKDLIYKKC